MASSYQSYSKNQFFYQSAVADKTMPSDSSCNSYYMDPQISADIDAACNVDFETFNKLSTDDAEHCVKRQLCQNKSLAEKNTNGLTENLQSGQRLSDTTDLYHQNLINTINLGVGILAMSYFIFANRATFGL